MMQEADIGELFESNADAGPAQALLSQRYQMMSKQR
jgi:hypothetical protein